VSELADKHALVLGADAIGHGIAVRFAREGAVVAVLDADLPAAEAAARAIEEGGGVPSPWRHHGAPRRGRR
jgi:3-oxoacyl-[acyl-carrier protein] reductase